MTLLIDGIDQGAFEFAPPETPLIEVAGEAALDQLGDWDGADGEHVENPAPPTPRGSSLRNLWMTDLADIARTTGRQVIEVPGWKTRGRAAMTGVEAVMWHHTATSAKATGDYPTLRIVRDGHPPNRDGKGGLAGPLSQFGIGRSGAIYVVAAGRANHAGSVYESWQQNSRCIGVEVEGDGRTPFNAAQLATMYALGAALHRSRYKVPVSRNTTHKQAAYRHYRKTDPLGVTPASVQAGINQALAAPTAATTVAQAVIAPTGTPKTLNPDGLYGDGTHDALMWWVRGDRLAAMTRDNVRDIQTWAGQARTGQYSKDDYRAIQRKVGAPVDGDWPWRWGTTRPSTTTGAIQRFLNRRINDTK